MPVSTDTLAQWSLHTCSTEFGQVLSMLGHTSGIPDAFRRNLFEFEQVGHTSGMFAGKLLACMYAWLPCPSVRRWRAHVTA